MTSKTYRIINGVIAGWLLFPVVLPPVSTFMTHYFPAVWQCAYRKMTGKDCPFCGLTRDLRNLFSGHPDRYNSQSHWFVILVGGLLVWRLICHLAAGRLNETALRRWAILDAIVTSALLGTLLFRLFFCRG